MRAAARMKGVVKPHAIPMRMNPKMYLMMVLGGSANVVEVVSAMAGEGRYADMLRWLIDANDRIQPLGLGVVAEGCVVGANVTF